MSDHRLDAARALYAALVAGQSGALPDLRERIERAFALTPREHFLGPPPWLVRAGGPFVDVRVADPIHLYQNVLVALDRDRGINNGEPFLHGQMIAALAPQRGERALHIGCGTGYYTSILATLIAPGGRITGYEITPDLAARAADNLAPWENADVVASSGADAALPRADIIYVSAGASRPADVWLDALNDNGRLVFPLTGADGSGVALKATRTGDAFVADVLGGVGFINCVGAREEAEALKVSEGLRNLRRAQVRRLRLIRDNDPDDATIVNGKGWRLAKPT